jgi:hypothetical protein
MLSYYPSFSIFAEDALWVPFACSLIFVAVGLVGEFLSKRFGDK